MPELIRCQICGERYPEPLIEHESTEVTPQKADLCESCRHTYNHGNVDSGCFACGGEDPGDIWHRFEFEMPVGVDNLYGSIEAYLCTACAKECGWMLVESMLYRDRNSSVTTEQTGFCRGWFAAIDELEERSQSADPAPAD